MCWFTVDGSPPDPFCWCRVVLNWNLTPGVYRHEKESDLHQSIWPEGFYSVSTTACRLCGWHLDV